MPRIQISKAPKSKANAQRVHSPSPPAVEPDPGISDTLFGRSVTLIDTPPGFEGGKFRVYGDEGIPKWMEEDPKEALATDGKPASKAALQARQAAKVEVPREGFSWIVPFGNLPPEATLSSHCLVRHDGATVDSEAETVALKIPKEIGKRVKIYRSSDGQNWQLLGNYPPNDFVDRAPGMTCGFYRIVALNK